MVAGDVTGDKRLPVSARPAAPIALLSVLTTNQRGAIAEAAVIFECAKLGIPVLRPLDDQRYDLVFDIEGRLIRVQVKYANWDGHVIYARLYSSRRARAGLLRRCYELGEVDAFALHCPMNERCYWLPADEFEGRTQVLLRLDKTKNNQRLGVNWASDYEFAAKLGALGAVAQLGERRDGIAEARGSSPLGSISARASR
jgi:PD-(D/E)XK endonuclease